MRRKGSERSMCVKEKDHMPGCWHQSTKGEMHTATHTHMHTQKHTHSQTGGRCSQWVVLIVWLCEAHLEWAGHPNLASETAGILTHEAWHPFYGLHLTRHRELPNAVNSSSSFLAVTWIRRFSHTYTLVDVTAAFSWVHPKTDHEQSLEHVPELIYGLRHWYVSS